MSLTEGKTRSQVKTLTSNTRSVAPPPAPKPKHPEVVYVTKDWKGNWRDDDFKILNSIPGVVIQPNISHCVDADIMVKAPEEATQWVHDNGILIHDAGAEEMIWDGSEILGRSKDGQWKSLETILEELE